MSIAGTIDAPLDFFGGLVTDMAAADLPQGVSPDCRDVAFLQGAVKTRPGLVSIYSPIAGNPTVNYLKTFTQPNLVNTLLAIDSAGTLWGENSPRRADADCGGAYGERGGEFPLRSSLGNTSRSTTATSVWICRASTTARISIA